MTIAAKKYALLGTLFFLTGFSGSVFAVYSKYAWHPSDPQNSGEVLGDMTTLEQDLTGNNTATPAPAETAPPTPPPAQAGEAHPAQLGGDSPPSPAPAPVPKPPAKPKIDICKVAKEELGKSQDQIEVKFLADSNAAKAAYDSEIAAANAKLLDLSRQRTESINNYLTAIAVATSKYNSSAKDPAAYQIYQQEQAAGLTAHTDNIARITVEETTAADVKNASQNKYDTALKDLETQKTQSLGSIQLKYQAQVAGIVCS